MFNISKLFGSLRKCAPSSEKKDHEVLQTAAKELGKERVYTTVLRNYIAIKELRQVVLRQDREILFLRGVLDELRKSRRPYVRHSDNKRDSHK